MVELVSRSPTSSRLFPSVGWKAPDTQQDGAAHIAQAVVQAVSRRRLETGRGLKSKRILRVVWLHCEAVAAEMSGRLEYADFLHRELDRDLKLIGESGSWMAAAELALSPPTATRLDEEVLRRIVVEELFVDTHLAFFNHAVASGSAVGRKHRAYLHLERAADLCGLVAPKGHAAPDPLELSLARARLSILKSDNAWEEVVSLTAEYARRLLNRPEYVRELGMARLGDLNSRLERASGDPARIAAVKRTILSLEDDRKVWPLEPVIHELLGLAYQRLAVFEANNRQLPDALVDIRRSIDRWGDDEGRALERQLHETLATVQSRMKQVEKEIASSWNRQLTPEGEQLRKMARVGTSLLETYLKSSERQAIERSSRAARAASIHRRLGLGILRAGDEARGLALLDFLDDLISQARDKPITRADAERVAAGHRDMAEVDLDTVVSFLGAPSQFVFHSGEAFPPGQQVTAPVALPGLSPAPRKTGIPSRIWMRSHQSRPWRVAAALSVVVVATSGALFAFDQDQRLAKAQAFAEVADAWARSDEKATADAIGRFRAVKTLALQDKRASAVDRIEANLQELPNQRTRDAAFEALLQASRKGRHLAVLDAAERYLSAPTIRTADPRLAQVRDLYSQHLIRWLTTSADTAGGDQEFNRRMQNYRKLTADKKA